MFSGLSTLKLDAKGRLAIPSRYRERLASIGNNLLVLTLNPFDPCLWLYPFPQWEIIDSKLQELSDFDQQSRRTKQMMMGYATECELDGQGRIRIPEILRQFANLEKDIVFLGQGNKFEIWDEAAWSRHRDEWLAQVGANKGAPSDLLRSLSF